jgi:hypothetical protein
MRLGIMSTLIFIGIMKATGFRITSSTGANRWAISNVAKRTQLLRAMSSSTTTVNMVAPRMKVSDINNSDPSNIIGKEIFVKGWVRTVRAQKSLAFIEVNDGSSRNGLQAVCDDTMASFQSTQELSTGVSTVHMDRNIHLFS